MRIAISTLSGISYGGVTYFRNLIPALARVDKDNEYHIFVKDKNPFDGLVHQGNFIFHEQSPKIDSALRRFWWEQWVFPRELKKNKIDVLFTTKNINVFLASCKTVISIRNMEPFCYRQYQNDWTLNCISWIKRVLSGFSIRKADKIIAVSNFVKDHLVKHFSSAGDKVVVIYNGNPVTNVHQGPVLEGQNPYLLSASKFVTYANQFCLVQGYAELYGRNTNIPDLWLAGGIHDQSYFQKTQTFIEDKGLAHKIKILGLVSHDRLLDLYKNALLFVFPSTLEACPHTLVEAMACGVPIATTKIAPMPEICQEAAVYFEPFEPKDIADKMALLLGDRPLREKLKKLALARSVFFDWDKTAGQLVDVFEGMH